MAVGAAADVGVVAARVLVAVVVPTMARLTSNPCSRKHARSLMRLNKLIELV